MHSGQLSLYTFEYASQNPLRISAIHTSFATELHKAPVPSEHMPELRFSYRLDRRKLSQYDTLIVLLTPPYPDTQG
jgi:hypothetical protein